MNNTESLLLLSIKGLLVLDSQQLMTDSISLFLKETTQLPAEADLPGKQLRQLVISLSQLSLELLALKFHLLLF